MAPRRTVFSCSTFWNAATVGLAAVILLSGDGIFHGALVGPSSGLRFATIAYASDDDHGRRPKLPEILDKAANHEPVQRPGNHPIANKGKREGRILPHGEGVQLSRQTSLSYDANRNTLNLHVKLGERGEARPHFGFPGFRGGPPPHEGGQIQTHAMVGIGGRAVEFQERAVTDTYIRGIAESVHGRTFETLEKSISPVSSRYQHSMFGLLNEGTTTVMAKTQIPIGGLSYLQREVLGVGADRESIQRAEALGFRAEPILTSETSDHSLVRFTVPSGLDAVRGQELLSRELPGQRFELNRVYRLYRASAREEPLTLDKSLPATAPGAAPTCAANHCMAREVIGWKDTLSSCARRLKVGVIDTDIDESHPAFEGARIHRFDFSPDGRLPSPNWHGTAVLALLAGAAQTNTPGLIPEAEFFSANVFYSDERGEMAADTVSFLKALDWMRTFDVKIINMSFAGPRDSLVGETIERMSEAGFVFVAAAGNEGPTAEPAYPAAYPQVIAVTAVTKDLRNYRYANRGDHIDISAPGVDIWTAAPGGRAGFHTGTSFAAPHVTAILAVEPPEILKEDKVSLLDNLAVMDLGEDGRDSTYGRGLLLAPTECTTPEEPSDTVASAAN